MALLSTESSPRFGGVFGTAGHWSLSRHEPGSAKRKFTRISRMQLAAGVRPVIVESKAEAVAAQLGYVEDRVERERAGCRKLGPTKIFGVEATSQSPSHQTTCIYMLLWTVSRRLFASVQVTLSFSSSPEECLCSEAALSRKTSTAMLIVR
jgi:hypothetical protein